MYKATWANDQQTTVYLAFEGAWQADEFADAEHDLHTMLSEVGHSVSVVVHLTQPQLISMDLVRQMRNFIALDHPNRHQVVIIAPEPLLAGVSEVVRRAFGGVQPPYVHYTHDLQQVDTLLLS